MYRITGKIIAALLTVGLSVSAPTEAAAAAVKVVLDAGHGGLDPGAVGVNGLYEKTVSLDVVLKLRNELRKRGYEVSLTRDQDVALTLAERVEFTKGVKPDLFVSVHANFTHSANVRGSMVLYYDKDYPQSDYPASDAMIALSSDSKELAQAVQSQMVREAGTADKGLIPSAVYVVRMGSVPSILVETAFLSNAQDAALLANDSYRQKFAMGIADGISSYKPAVIEPPGAFPDIAASHWANDAVAKLKAKGIIQGEENGWFYPDRPLTRAEFVVLLERQFILPDLLGCSGTAKISDTCAKAAAKPSDLRTSHWAYTSVLNAVKLGILSGHKDGTVRPDAPISRGEAAALIDRTVWPGSSQTAKTFVFQDVPKTLWSAAAINRLKDKGVIDGVTSTDFAPEKAITRAEMSVLLVRLLR